MGKVWDVLMNSASSPGPITNGLSHGSLSVTDEPEWRELERIRVAQAALGFCEIFRPHWTCHHASGHFPNQPEKAPIPTQASRASLRLFPRKIVTVHGPLPEARGFE